MIIILVIPALNETYLYVNLVELWYKRVKRKDTSKQPRLYHQRYRKAKHSFLSVLLLQLVLNLIFNTELSPVCVCAPITGCLLCCTVCLTGCTRLNAVLWCELVSHGQTHLFIFNKPVSNGCCHRRLQGLSRGDIKVLLIRLVAFLSKLIGISSPYSVQFL